MTVPMRQIGQVCSLQKGGVNPQKFPAELFAHYSIPAFDEGMKPSMDLGASIRSQKTAIQSGSVLVSKLNPRIPRVWHVQDEQEARKICSTEFVPLLPKRNVLDPSYLVFALLHLLASGAISGSTSAATKSRERAKPADIAQMLIPVPPLERQTEIADLLSRAEGIVRLRREAAAKAAELIPALFIHHFGDPATNPMGWRQCTLGDVVNIASGGTPSKARPDFWEGDLPWVSPKDMKRTVIVDAIDHISPKVVQETSLKLVPKDAVLIVVRGMILAHTVPIAITARPVTINQDMKALTAKEGVMPAFLLWHLKVMHHELLGATSTAAHGTKKLETKDLLRQPVVVPPLALQGQFCEQLMAMESIQRQQIDALAKAQATFDALLAQAFAPT